jgi:hypothetical protein
MLRLAVERVVGPQIAPHVGGDPFEERSIEVSRVHSMLDVSWPRTSVRTFPS